MKTPLRYFSFVFLPFFLVTLASRGAAETFAEVRLRIASNKWAEAHAYLEGHPNAPDQLAAVNVALEALQELRKLDIMADMLGKRYELMVADPNVNLDHLFNRTFIPLVQYRIGQHKRPDALALIARARKDFENRPQAASVATVLQQLEELAKPLEAGDTIPAFSFVDVLTNAPVDSSKLKGKYLLLEFWVTSCDICARQKDTIKEILPLYKDAGLEVIGFSQDENPEKVKTFLEREGITWSQCLDSNPQYRFAEKMKVDFIPTNFLVDPSGTILGVNLRGEDLEETLKGIFKSP